MRLGKRNTPLDHELPKHCHVYLERLSESELSMLENKTAKRRGRKRKGEELKHHPPLPSKRGRPPAQIASNLETPPEHEGITANKPDTNVHKPRETRHSRQDNEKRKDFAASNRTKNQTVENETTKEISKHKDKIPGRDDRSTKHENVEKSGFSMHFRKEGTNSVKSDDGQTSKSWVRFGFDIYAKTFKNYLYALILNENDMKSEISQRNLEPMLITLDDVANESLVKWILEVSLNIKDISLEDQWVTVKNAAMEAEKQVSIESQNSKNITRLLKKRLPPEGFYFFPQKTPEIPPSDFVKEVEPINDGASTSTKDVCDERGNLQISSSEANRNSSKASNKSPVLEKDTITVQVIDTVPSNEREATTSSTFHPGIPKSVNDIAKEDQFETVKNAAMEAEEALLKFQKPEDENKMSGKRMAEESVNFPPTKTPRLSPTAFVETARPISDGEPSSSQEICNERERFQTNSGEANRNSPKTLIPSLLEEITSTFEAINTNQFDVPTNEREAATSSNLKSNLMKPVNEITTQQEPDASPLSDDDIVITDLVIVKVPEINDTKTSVEKFENCDKIQELSNECNNDTGLEGNEQQENLCATQKASNKSPVLQKDTSTVQVIDTVPSSEREATTSSTFHPGIPKPVNDIAKEDQLETVKNAAMEAEEALLKFQKPEGENKRSGKRMAEESVNFPPTKTPMWSPTAFFEATRPIGDGEPSSSEEICNERERFQTSSSEANRNFPKTLIPSLLEEITTNQFDVPTNEMEAATSSNLKSNIIEPVNEITTQQEHDSSPLPDDDIVIPNLVIVKVPEINETKTSVENLENCDKIQELSNECNNDIGLEGNEQQESLCATQKASDKSPVLEKDTSTVQVIDTVPTSEREATISSTFHPGIPKPVNDTAKEDQLEAVKNAAMEAEEVFLKFQKPEDENKMPGKRIAEESINFPPTKTPRLSPTAFVETARPIGDGEPSSSQEICNERERFQTSSGEANRNSPKTLIPSLLEEITTNQFDVPTNEMEAATSSNLKSNIMKPVNEITTQQEHDASPLPDDDIVITNLLIVKVPEINETKTSLENLENCDKIQELSNECNNDIGLEGNEQQESLCTTQKLDTISIVEEVSMTSVKVDEASEFNVSENLETSKQQEGIYTMHCLNRTTDSVIIEKTFNEIQIFEKNLERNKKPLKPANGYNIIRNDTEQENLTDNEKAQETFSSTIEPSDIKFKEDCDLSMLIDIHGTSEEKKELAFTSDIEEKTSSFIENSIITNNISDKLCINNTSENSNQFCISKSEEINDTKPSQIPGENNVIKTLLDECIQFAENQVISHVERNEAIITEIQTNYVGESPRPAFDLRFIQDAAEARNSSLEIIPTAGENSLSVNSSTNDEEICQLMNDVLANVVKTGICYNPQLPCTTSDMASNNNNAEGNEETVPLNISMRVNSTDEALQPPLDEANHPSSDEANCPSLDTALRPSSDEALQSPSHETLHSPSDGTLRPSSDEALQSPSHETLNSPSDETLRPSSDQAFRPPSDQANRPSSDEKALQLVKETSSEVVSLTKTQAYIDARTAFPCSISDLKSNLDIPEEERTSSPTSASTSDSSFLLINSSTDGKESNSLFIKTPENTVSVIETTSSCKFQTSTHLSFDMESVHETTEENTDLLPADISKHKNSPSEESSTSGDKLSGFVNNTSQNLIFMAEIESPNLISDIKSVHSTPEEKDSSSPAAVSTPDERPDDDKILLEDSNNADFPHLTEEREKISSTGNVSAVDKKMCRDIVEEIIKDIENGCIEKQLNENMNVDKISNASLKNESGVKEDKLEVESAKQNFTSVNGSNEKYKPKYKGTLFSEDNKINCDEHRSQVYEVISDGEKDEDKNGEDDVSPCKSLDIFVRPEIPEGVFILKSDCLGYLNELKQTIDDKDGFKSDYSGSRLAQESKLRDIAKKIKDKRREIKKTKKNSHKLSNGGKKGFFWRGFDFDF
ncbi:unnamed protein product [Larinioides sclopetarius]|uniref:Uncharacterized protein n=1 Tax=Larinioides sclopetarius TaxID=280406 RepID=A0AAV2AWX2_9ARAC